MCDTVPSLDVRHALGSLAPVGQFGIGWQVSLIERALGDPLVREALSEAGWGPGYRHDAEGWIESLRAEGFTVHAAGAEVLALLGGLRIPARRSARAVFGSGALVVDPLRAATGEASRIQSRERQLSTGLCPVGEWMDEYIVLTASDGRVLAETTFQVLQLGKDLSEALVRIVKAESPPRLLIGRGSSPLHGLGCRASGEATVSHIRRSLTPGPAGV
jgi:hypothetical protein